jgi:HEAT repeat protein
VAAIEGLSHPDPGVRCQTCTAILVNGAQKGIDLVLPALNDPDSLVRWQVCGLMHDFGDDRAVKPLIARMREDPNPQVRGTAAYAFGRHRQPGGHPGTARDIGQR